jgi:hypothetical protein
MHDDAPHIRFESHLGHRSVRVAELRWRHGSAAFFYSFLQAPIALGSQRALAHDWSATRQARTERVLPELDVIAKSYRHKRRLIWQKRRIENLLSSQ